jgi:hypothetical protein
LTVEQPEELPEQSTPLTVDGKPQSLSGKPHDTERSTGFTRTLQEPSTELVQENSYILAADRKNRDGGEVEEGEANGNPAPKKDRQPALDEEELHAFIRADFTTTELTDEQVATYAGTEYFRRKFWKSRTPAVAHSSPAEVAPDEPWAKARRVVEAAFPEAVWEEAESFEGVRT